MLLRLTILAALTVSSQGAGGVTKLGESLKSLSPGARRDIVIEMEPVLGQVLTNPSITSLTGDARRNQIITLLQERSRISQIPVMNALTTLGIVDRAKSFWVANRIVVRDVDIGAIQALSKFSFGLPMVIREPIKAKILPITAIENIPASRARADNDTTQYGVAKINAPKVWAKGNRGEGIVVGIIDTGVNAQHIALRDNYKNDAYSWKDAFGEYDTPYDGNGHGTHCTGTICGTTNGIGVAPAAKYISCRGLDDAGSGDDTTLITCGEFMACPSGNSSTSTNGTTTRANCTGFPNIVSNSWGGLVGAQDFYNPVISTWVALGIIPVFALGNSGPLCMTAGSPGDQENIISVGATDDKDKLASFSSRGPALISGKTKPEVSAPGNKIISATHDSDDGYRALSGTSMACPHVAGATALLLSAFSAAKKEADFTTVRNTLEKTAFKPTLIFTDFYKVCSPMPSKFPNNGYGYGRIDIDAAVTSVASLP